MSNQKRIFLSLISVLIGIGLGALVLYSTRPKPQYVSPYVPGSTPPPVPEPGSEPVQTTAPSPDPENKTSSVMFYKVVDSPDGPVLHSETHVVEGEKPTEEARLTVAIQAMSEGELPVLPKGTKLLRLKREGKLAVLDLSKELKDNFPGGDRAERLAVNALVATAGQLPGVEKVQIFVEGVAIETLGGTQTYSNH